MVLLVARLPWCRNCRIVLVAWELNPLLALTPLFSAPSPRRTSWTALLDTLACTMTLGQGIVSLRPVAHPVQRVP